MTAAKFSRKPISKKLRFEIFKRDGFACQYCGGTPPHSVLHVDHITPVSLGGDNTDENLITACRHCNLGKSATPLSSVPRSLAEKAADIEEREAQIIGYAAVMSARKRRLEDEAWYIAESLTPGASNGYPRKRLQSILVFLRRLPLSEVEDAIEISLARIGTGDSNVFRYFCGVCWKKIRDAEE